MNKIIFFILAFGFASTVKAQDVTGDWYGSIKISGAQFRLVFHINKLGDTYSTTLDSPDQAVKGLSTDKTTFTENAIKIEASKIGIMYKGTYKPDSNIINGFFVQGTINLPLVFSRKQPENTIGVVKRVQEPTTFPYKREDVAFINTQAGNILAGTLTLPSTGKVTKIVVLISGSGAQDRNEALQDANHRPFLIWSDWLTRNGIAVLRYDDRGVGKSTGVFATATTADLANDAEAAINYIRSREDLNKLSIGLIGHSEGAIIASMVASRNNAVKFISLLAGPGVPIIELAQQQLMDQLRLAGMSEQVMKIPPSFSRSIFKMIVDNPKLSNEELKPKINTMIIQMLNVYPSTSFTVRSKQAVANIISLQLLSPWYRYFLSLKPANYLSKVKCAVLAINGTLDMQVECTSNLAAIKAALNNARNQHHEEVPLMGLNHFFQKAKTGSVNEYAQIAETVNPQALKLVANWINMLN